VNATLAAFACGLLFAVGLALGGMTQPSKVVGFLDFTGAWDASLALVMGGALVTHGLLRPLVLRRARPLFAPGFSLASKVDIDRRLIAGAAIFGVGWGLGGFCPGPAIVALGAGARAAIIVVPAMLVGMVLHDHWRAAVLAVALRAGTLAGLAMVPFAAMFRGLGWRVNEYGRKTLELVAGDIASPARDILMLVQHQMIAVVASVPLLLVLHGVPDRRVRVVLGAIYGVGFYFVVNATALPAAFGDPVPWELGVTTVIPSLVVHVVYGLVLGWLAPASSR
jgi:uncharacterized membrane protein YedE/YeeE